MSQPRKELALCVFVDALGAELAARHRLLDGVLQTRGALGTVLGYSCTCAPTILTGLSPREHGHFSFFSYAPERSPFGGLGWLDALPKALGSRARVRAIVSRLVGQRLGMTGYFNLYNVPFKLLPLFDYSERRDLYQAGGIISGAETIFDRLRAEQLPFHLSDWRRPEPLNLARARADLLRGEARFAYIYLPALDGIMHAEGPDGPAAAAKVRQLDATLRRLLDELGTVYDRVRLFVFSDHGMTRIRRSVDLQREVAQSGLEFGVDYAAMYDSTLARFWFLRPGAREKIEARLGRVRDGHVLSPQELQSFGCDFDDARYGELFFLLDPGTLLCPSFMGERPVAGMHGFDPRDRDSLAFFGSSELLETPPRRLEDLFGLMWDEACRAAGRQACAPAA